MKINRTHRTQVLVVGAGAAGCRAAIAAADEGADVILANKGPVARSGITLTAGGGIMAPFHPEDSPEFFFNDIIKNGYGLADQNLAAVVASEACDRILDLDKYGVNFLRDDKGDFDLRQFPGQSIARNVILKGGGVGMMRGLHKACRGKEKITILEDFAVLRLLLDGQGNAAGAIGLNLKNGEIVLIEALATVIATGGYQALWEVNDCPADSTGDGVILAYNAGARLVDLEMLLFYPSVVIHPDAVKGCFVHYEFLSPWALDGEIRDRNGVPVVEKPMPVRDVAMRKMARAIEEGRGTERGGLFWDVTSSPKEESFKKNFLNNPQYNHLRALGVEPLEEMIEVAPGAHYQLGGIFIDPWGKTNVEGIFASPEAGGNFEGTNRLSGSALIGTQVFGYRSGKAAGFFALNKEGEAKPSKEQIEETMERIRRFIDSQKDGISPITLKQELKKITQKSLGVFRDENGLTEYIKQLEGLKGKLEEVKVNDWSCFNQGWLDALEVENMINIGGLIALAAQERKESRGHHFRNDFPEKDEKWNCHTIVRKDELETKCETAEIITGDFISLYKSSLKLN